MNQLDQWNRKIRTIWYCSSLYVEYKNALRKSKKMSVDKKTEFWEKKHEEFATKVLNNIYELKGWWVKVGQFLSTQDNLIPTAYIEKLTKLQDMMPTSSYDKIEAILKKELGNLEELFEHIDKEPLASASIGQVHKAKILKRKGTCSSDEEYNVIVKIQHEGIDQFLTSDIDTLKNVSWAFGLIDKNFYFNDFIDEWQDSASRELNYMYELYHQVLAYNTFKKSKIPLKIPKIYCAYTTTKVLVMEYINGFKITDLHLLKKYKVNTYKLVYKIIDYFAYQIHNDGFFHGDPHPGNILVMKKEYVPKWKRKGKRKPFLTRGLNDIDGHMIQNLKNDSDLVDRSEWDNWKGSSKPPVCFMDSPVYSTRNHCNSGLINHDQCNVTGTSEDTAYIEKRGNDSADLKKEEGGRVVPTLYELDNKNNSYKKHLKKRKGKRYSFIPVIIDWGLIKQVDSVMQLAFCKLIYNISCMNVLNIIEAFEDMGFCFKEDFTYDPEIYIENLKRFFLKKLQESEKTADQENLENGIASGSKDEKKKKPMELLKRIDKTEALGKNPVSDVPKDIIFFIRVASLLHGLCSQMKVKINYLSIFAKRAKEALEKIYNPISHSIYTIPIDKTPNSFVEKRIHKFLSRMYRQKKILGCQVAIIHNKKLVVNTCVGETSNTDKRPITKHSLFNGYCLNKCVLTLALLHLITNGIHEQGGSSENNIYLQLSREMNKSLSNVNEKELEDEEGKKVERSLEAKGYRGFYKVPCKKFLTANSKENKMIDRVTNGLLHPHTDGSSIKKEDINKTESVSKNEVNWFTSGIQSCKMSSSNPFCSLNKQQDPSSSFFHSNPTVQTPFGNPKQTKDTSFIPKRRREEPDLLHKEKIEEQMRKNIEKKQIENFERSLKEYICNYWDGFICKNKKNVTIKDILTHKCIIEKPFHDKITLSKFIDYDKMIDMIENARNSRKKSKNKSSKDGKYLYLIYSYIVAELIHMMSGMKYHEYIYTYIVKPLHLKDEMFIPIPSALLQATESSELHKKLNTFTEKETIPSNNMEEKDIRKNDKTKFDHQDIRWEYPMNISMSSKFSVDSPNAHAFPQQDKEWTGSIDEKIERKQESNTSCFNNRAFLSNKMNSNHFSWNRKNTSSEELVFRSARYDEEGSMSKCSKNSIEKNSKEISTTSSNTKNDKKHKKDRTSSSDILYQYHINEYANAKKNAYDLNEALLNEENNDDHVQSSTKHSGKNSTLILMNNSSRISHQGKGQKNFEKKNEVLTSPNVLTVVEKQKPNTSNISFKNKILNKVDHIKEKTRQINDSIKNMYENNENRFLKKIFPAQSKRTGETSVMSSNPASSNNRGSFFSITSQKEIYKKELDTDQETSLFERNKIGEGMQLQSIKQMDTFRARSVSARYCVTTPCKYKLQVDSLEDEMVNNKKKCCIIKSSLFDQYNLDSYSCTFIKNLHKERCTCHRSSGSSNYGSVEKYMNYQEFKMNKDIQDLFKNTDTKSSGEESVNTLLEESYNRYHRKSKKYSQFFKYLKELKKGLANKKEEAIGKKKEPVIHSKRKHDSKKTKQNNTNNVEPKISDKELLKKLIDYKYFLLRQQKNKIIGKKKKNNIYNNEHSDDIEVFSDTSDSVESEEQQDGVSPSKPKRKKTEKSEQMYMNEKKKQLEIYLIMNSSYKKNKKGLIAVEHHTINKKTNILWRLAHARRTINVVDKMAEGNMSKNLEHFKKKYGGTKLNSDSEQGYDSGENEKNGEQDKIIRDLKKLDTKINLFVENYNVRAYNKYVSLFHLIREKPYILDPLIYDSKKILDKYIPINGRITAKAMCKLFAFTNNEYFFPKHVLNRIRNKYTIDRSLECCILTAGFSRSWGIGFQLFECEYDGDINEDYYIYKKEHRKLQKKMNYTNKDNTYIEKKPNTKTIVGYGQSDISGCLAISFPEIDLSLTILLTDILKGAQVSHLILDYILKLYGIKPKWKIPLQISQIINIL